MSSNGEDYCRFDRFHRQCEQLASDRYHHGTTSSSCSYDPYHDRYCNYSSSDRYDGGARFQRQSHQQQQQQQLSAALPAPPPPLPSSYALDSEPFIPPPERYLSPPAPAPPDRFYERFLLSTNDLHLPPASSTIDKYKRYKPPSPSRDFTHPGDPYIRRDLGYHNHYRLDRSSASASHYQKSQSQSRTCCRRSYLPSTSSLPRCISISDAEPSAARRSIAQHGDCCSHVRSSSPAATADSYSLYSVAGLTPEPHAASLQLPTVWKPTAAAAAPAGTATAIAAGVAYHHQQCSSPSSVSSAGCASPSNVTSISASASATVAAYHQARVVAAAASQSPKRVSALNSPSLSFSSRSSSSLQTTNTTASTTTSPTAPSPNRMPSGGDMEWRDEHSRISRSVSVPATAPVTGSSAPTQTPTVTEVIDSDAEPSCSRAASDGRRTLHYSNTAPLSLPPRRSPHQKPPLHHQVSTPVTANERATTSSRIINTLSKVQEFRSYVNRETAMFFGIYQPTERVDHYRWTGKRKRMAIRTYGGLKPEFESVVPGSPSTRPDVLPMRSTRARQLATDEMDSEIPGGGGRGATLKRKPSVAKLTISGVAYVVSTLSRHRKRSSSGAREYSRSYAPSSVPVTPSTPLEDEVFFDKPSTSGWDEVVEERRAASSSETAEAEVEGDMEETTATYDEMDSTPASMSHQQQSTRYEAQRTRNDRYYTWRRKAHRKKVRPEEEHEEGTQIGLCRIWNRLLDRALDNSDRRQYGMGVVGKFFGRSLKRSVTNREPVKEQLDDLEDHRPFFTYWITTAQILILILSIFAYGFGPIGFNLTQRSGLVLVTSLSLQQVEYSEPSNFWIGPRAADLIHMGAKFGPCMRNDFHVRRDIERNRMRERETACCIRNDDSGCIQASKQECSKAISTWKKWPDNESGSGGRLSGPVCGLDPRFCEAPASVAPYEWPDDITKWPICRKINSRLNTQQEHHQQRFQVAAEHMVCEVIGHPCCIGIHGTCRITTKEYCDFVRGYFHEEASLCSQVTCLNDVCGMLPFYYPEIPDQIYRLWMSLFIHAGILHLAVTIFIQFYLMRDLEKLTGSLRISIIYLGSGITGNIASAVFVPYRADVGPAGGQFGLLACLMVEVINCWSILKRPYQALSKLILITLALFLFGLLPWVDNFAHIFGFLMGFCLSYAFLPFLTFGSFDRYKKQFWIWIALLVAVCLFAILTSYFYYLPFNDCDWCRYINCIPLTDDFCATQDINFKKDEYVV